MANYIAVVHKEPKSDFGVSFPDFPGCITAGSSIDEAKDMDDPDYSDAAAILVVSVSAKKPRSVRVNITVPEDMLRKIDSVAKKKGMSRSSFLVHAAQNAITSKKNSHPQQ